jgi:predicted GNAT family acetyltransferase
MNDSTEANRYTLEYPDEAGYPGGVGIPDRDTAVLIDEVIDDADVPSLEFHFAKDDKNGIYEAIIDGTAIAGLPYNVASGGRLVLLATSVFPEFRKQGVATELIRRVLEDVRAQGKTVTVMCPIVHTFIERNPGYGDLVDPKHPGVAKRSHRS